MGVSRGRRLAAGSSRPLRSLRRGGGQRGIRYPRFRGAGSIKFRRLLRRCCRRCRHNLASRPPPQYCQPPTQPSEPARSSNPPPGHRDTARPQCVPPWRSPRGSQIAPDLTLRSLRRLGTTAWSRLCIWICIPALSFTRAWTLADEPRRGAVDVARQQFCIHLASSDRSLRSDASLGHACELTIFAAALQAAVVQRTTI